MKKTRFTEEQILFALKQGAAGQPISDVCRQMGISEATYYVWKKKYADMGILEVRELRQLRDENSQLKRVVADLTLDRHVLQEVIKTKDLSTPRRRDIARWIHDFFQLSIRRSCALSCLRNATWYYRSQAQDSSALRSRLRELATARPRFGYERLHILLTRDGWQVGRNRVHRLYKLEGLQVRMRARRRKRVSMHRGPVPVATAGGQYWAMDFVYDQLSTGRTFRVLTVIDKWHRQCVALGAAYCLNGHSVVDTLNQIALGRDLPYAITVEHGTEVTSKALDEWCHMRGVKLDCRLTPNEFAIEGQKTGSEASKL